MSTVGTRNFTYDNQRQLTSAYRIDGNGQPLPTYNFSYAFDPIGNWTKATSSAGETDFTSNELNQYIAVAKAGANPSAPQYDRNGNMTSDGQGNTYVYDEENRLVEADTPGQAAAKIVSVYDGLSRRVEKRVYNAGGTLTATTRYLYDGLLPIAEYDASNNLTNSYTRGLDLSGSLQGAGGIGGLLALTTNGTSYDYFTDGNGNVVDLTNLYGVSAAHYEYDPFGNLVFQSGTLQQNYQWSSKESDLGAGLIYYGFRFYNSTLGRWQNRDPIDENGGLNTLAFEGNRPDEVVDAFGLAVLPAAPPTYTFRPLGPLLQELEAEIAAASRVMGAAIFPMWLPGTLDVPNPIPVWTDPLVKQMYDDDDVNACKQLAESNYGQNQYFYSNNLSELRSTGSFAVIWHKEAGQSANVIPPGYMAANTYIRKQADRGHLIPKQWGGKDRLENIVAQSSNYNKSTQRSKFDNEIGRQLQTQCYVCAFAVPKYTGVGRHGAHDPGSPAPSSFEYRLLGRNVHEQFTEPAQTLRGNWKDDIAPWNIYDTGVVDLN